MAIFVRDDTAAFAQAWRLANSPQELAKPDFLSSRFTTTIGVTFWVCPIVGLLGWLYPQLCYSVL